MMSACKQNRKGSQWDCSEVFITRAHQSQRRREEREMWGAGPLLRRVHKEGGGSLLKCHLLGCWTGWLGRKHC